MSTSSHNSAISTASSIVAMASADSITLNGSVGFDFDAKTVAEHLSFASGPIEVNLNSGGGLPFEGVAIYTALKEYSGYVTVRITGIAASAASLIAMAGDTIEMVEGSMMMIHEPSNALTEGRGTSSEHKHTARLLDAITKSVAPIYSKKSGKSLDEITQIMAAETWFTPDEAVAAGFADSVSSDERYEMAAQFNYRNYSNAPLSLVQMATDNNWTNQFRKEKEMNAIVQKTEMTDPHASLAPVLAKADKSDPKKELKRVKALMVLCSSDPAKAVSADARMQEWIDNGVTQEAANDWVLNELAAMNTNAPSGRHRQNDVGMSWDNGLGLTDRIVDGVFARVDRKHQPTVGREFAAMSLSEVADVCLKASGQSTFAKSAIARVEMALHSTSDFPSILRDVGNKSLMGSYEAAQSTIKVTSREVRASNFRTLHSIKVSSGADLDEIGESGEYKSGTIEEGEETFAVKTYGKIFGVTRQAIVNDDLDVFTNMFPRLGQGAASTEAKLFVELLEANSGGGVKLSDDKVLFHADHKNLAATGLAPSITSLSSARTAMRRQTGIASEAISVTPTFLIVPPELETIAEQLLADIAATEAANANPFSGKLSLLVEPRLVNPKAWYMSAQPGNPDCLQHAYLDGATGPQIMTREGFEVDGLEYKVRLDFGAGFTDHRGWYMNPGE